MTISADQGPPGGHELLGRVVPHLIKVRPSSKRIVGGGPPRASAPLRIYTIGMNDALLADPLKKARFVGWRYLIDDNGSVAVADIRPGEAGAPRFSNLTRGAFAIGLQQAAEQAHALYETSTDAYEARILEVPAVYSISLWLHGKRDLFFRYIEPNGQVPAMIDESPNYLAQIGTMAREKAGKFQAPAAHAP